MPTASTMNTPDNVQVRPRDLHFTTGGVTGRFWMGGDPAATAVFNALSITFPEGERVFIDAVKAYREGLTGKLAEDVRGFIAQEAIHSREHASLNRHLDPDHYPVAEIEAELAQRLVFLRGRGPMAMLGVTIALEHFTAMMADLFLDDPAFWDGVAPDLIQLWQWHAMEETEHKAVAFDVWRHATRAWSPLRRYIFRVRMMTTVTLLFTHNIRRFSAKLLAADGFTPAEADARVRRYLFKEPGLFSRCMNVYWAWYRPGFHPWAHDNRAKLAEWRVRFAPA